MKKETLVKTRWQYHVANGAGLIILPVLLVTCIRYSIKAGAIDFKSLMFWIAVLLLIIFPYAIISFFSSMKSVVITEKELIISYVFQKHQNRVFLSAITGFRSRVKQHETTVRPASFSDTFSLTVADGRSFSFAYSQFDQYDKLKSVVYNAFRRNKKY